MVQNLCNSNIGDYMCVLAISLLDTYWVCVNLRPSAKFCVRGVCVGIRLVIKVNSTSSSKASLEQTLSHSATSVSRDAVLLTVLFTSEIRLSSKCREARQQPFCPGEDCANKQSINQTNRQTISRQNTTPHTAWTHATSLHKGSSLSLSLHNL